MSKPMTFNQYVLSRRGGPNPRGDFIDDFKADAEIERGRQFTSWERLRGYLWCRNACDGAMAAAKAMWGEYKRYRRQAKA
jgi:hypothetical protein